MVRERDHICGPIADPAARLKIGAAEARPIGNNNADCKLPRQRLITKQMPFEFGAGRAVEIEDWSTISCTMFVISEPTACGQAELLVRFGHSLSTPMTPSASELEGQHCREQIHWPVHDDHPRETARPQIDELKDHD